MRGIDPGSRTTLELRALGTGSLTAMCGSAKLQDEVGSLGVVLHSFLEGRKHYAVGEKTSTIAFQQVLVLLGWRSQWPTHILISRPPTFWQELVSYEKKSRREQTLQMLTLEHMQMKPLDWQGCAARFSDAKDLLLLMLDERNVMRLDAQDNGAFSLASQHPLLWTTPKRKACPLAG